MAKAKAKAKVPPGSAICQVPGCYRQVDNKTRGICSRCAGSFFYYRRRYGAGQTKRGARVVAERRAKLQFWNERLKWLFADDGDNS